MSKRAIIINGVIALFILIFVFLLRKNINKKKTLLRFRQNNEIIFYRICVETNLQYY